MPGRGVAAYRRQAEAQAARSAGGYANKLIVKTDESVVVRFRGLFHPMARMTEKQLRRLVDADGGLEWCEYLASTLGMPSQDKPDEWVKAFLTRYEQNEPFTVFEHYVNGLRGRDAYATCSDGTWPDVEFDCVDCVTMHDGDRRISRRMQAVYTVQPIRKIHKIEGKKDGKTAYPFCGTLDNEDGDGSCRYCDRGNTPTWEGLRYLMLSQTHADGVQACIARVEKRCASCEGIGKVRRVGWRCSNVLCQEPASRFRYIEEVGEGENVEDVNVYHCKACKRRAYPEEVLTCTRDCEVPRRVRIHDVNVTIQRLGSQKNTSYSFTEEFPCADLDPELLARKIPMYEAALKPASPAERCRALGLTHNPLTGDAVGSAPSKRTSSYDAEDEDDDEEDENPYGEEEDEDEDDEEGVTVRRKKRKGAAVKKKRSQIPF